MFGLDWPYALFLAVVVGTVVFVAVLIAAGIFTLIDSVGTAHQNVSGTVGICAFTPAHTNVGTMIISGTVMPQITYVADTWVLDIHTPDGSGTIALDHAPAPWQVEGSAVSVSYRRGRFSDAFRITSIQSP